MTQITTPPFSEMANPPPFDKSGCSGCKMGKPFHELLLCARCHTVRYCDQLCQRRHWPLHKAACKLDTKLVRVDRHKPVTVEHSHGPMVEIDARHYSTRGGSTGRAHTPPTLSAVFNAAVMPPGAKPCTLGSSCYGQEMINDEEGANTLEAWFGFYDVEPDSRLPSPKARARVRVMFLEEGDDEFQSLLFQAANGAHFHMGAANPPNIALIPKSDPRVSSARCTCGGLALNGPHVNPRVRTLLWDRVALTPKREGQPDSRAI
jgi:hypothetical protein